MLACFDCGLFKHGERPTHSTAIVIYSLFCLSASARLFRVGKRRMDHSRCVVCICWGTLFVLCAISAAAFESLVFDAPLSSGLVQNLNITLSFRPFARRLLFRQLVAVTWCNGVTDPLRNVLVSHRRLLLQDRGFREGGLVPIPHPVIACWRSYILTAALERVCRY